MSAAKRAVRKLMRDVRDAAEAETADHGVVLMAWGYQKIEDNERRMGVVL